MHTHYTLSVAYVVVHLLAPFSVRQVNGAPQPQRRECEPGDNECTTSKGLLRTYCPNTFTVAISHMFVKYTNKLEIL